MEAKVRRATCVMISFRYVYQRASERTNEAKANVRDRCANIGVCLRSSLSHTVVVGDERRATGDNPRSRINDRQVVHPRRDTVIRHGKAFRSIRTLLRVGLEHQEAAEDGEASHIESRRLREAKGNRRRLTRLNGDARRLAAAVDADSSGRGDIGAGPLDGVNRVGVERVDRSRRLVGNGIRLGCRARVLDCARARQYMVREIIKIHTRQLLILSEKASIVERDDRWRNVGRDGSEGYEGVQETAALRNDVIEAADSAVRGIRRFGGPDEGVGNAGDVVWLRELVRRDISGQGALCGR